MRRLGQVLGVEAMSLYNHVANKDDILDGIVDIVVGEIELPAPGPTGSRRCGGRALSAHDVFVRHPWAASLIPVGNRVRPARWRYMDAILGMPSRSGLLGRDDRSRVSRPGEPHRGLHAVGGGVGYRPRRTFPT